jgi:hypothetical protein
VILKLEYLLYQNIYILFQLILYSWSHFNSNKCKKTLIEKKHANLQISMLRHGVIMFFSEHMLIKLNYGKSLDIPLQYDIIFLFN